MMQCVCCESMQLSQKEHDKNDCAACDESRSKLNAEMRKYWLMNSEIQERVARLRKLVEDFPSRSELLQKRSLLYSVDITKKRIQERKQEIIKMKQENESLRGKIELGKRENEMAITVTNKARKEVERLTKERIDKVQQQIEETKKKRNEEEELLMKRRKQAATQLFTVMPVVPFSGTDDRIVNYYLPKDGYWERIDQRILDQSLQYIAKVVSLLAYYLDVAMPYQVEYVPSISKIWPNSNPNSHEEIPENTMVTGIGLPARRWSFRSNSMPTQPPTMAIILNHSDSKLFDGILWMGKNVQVLCWNVGIPLGLDSIDDTEENNEILKCILPNIRHLCSSQWFGKNKAVLLISCETDIKKTVKEVVISPKPVGASPMAGEDGKKRFEPKPASPVASPSPTSPPGTAIPKPPFPPSDEDGWEFI